MILGLGCQIRQLEFNQDIMVVSIPLLCSATVLRVRQHQCFTRANSVGTPILSGTQHFIFGWIEAGPLDTIFFDTNGDWSDLRPVSELKPIDFPAYLQGAVTITCESKSFTQWKYKAGATSSFDDGFANVRYAIILIIFNYSKIVFISFFLIGLDFRRIIDAIRFVWPQVDPHPFWPAPAFSASWQYQGYTDNQNNLTARPGRLALVVLLAQRLGEVPSLTPNYLNYQFLTEDEFDNCNITFNGLIANSSGVIRATLSEFEDADMSCDLDAFKARLSTLYDLLDQSNRFDDLTDDVYGPALIGYQMDLVISSKDYYTCEEGGELFVEKTPYRGYGLTRVCFAEYGSEEFANDPCCSIPNGVAEFTACRAANRSYPQFRAVVLPGIESVFSSLPQCAAKSFLLLNDFENR